MDERGRRVRQRGKPVFEGRQVLKDRELIPVERRAADDKGVESPRTRQQRVSGEQAAERMAEQDLLGPDRLRIARRDFGAQRLDEKGEQRNCPDIALAAENRAAIAHLRERSRNAQNDRESWAE